MSDLAWKNVDLDTLTAVQREAYEDYKEAQREAAKLRTAFEELMQAGVPTSRRLVFGYRFGKLSVALAEDDRKPPKAASKALSLADYLAQQGVL